MKQRFRSLPMQRTYEDCLNLVANKESHFWTKRHIPSPNYGNGLRSAFWQGYNSEPLRYLRTSLAYAAYKAGQDFERAGR
jgi:hypothetical protein